MRRPEMPIQVKIERKRSGITHDSRAAIGAAFVAGAATTIAAERIIRRARDGKIREVGGAIKEKTPSIPSPLRLIKRENGNGNGENHEQEMQTPTEQPQPSTEKRAAM